MPELKREQFVQQVIDIARDRFPVAKVSRADQPFSLKVNGQIASLENLYRSAALQPEQAVTFIEQWMLELVRASEGTPDLSASFDELADRIMPVVLREDAFKGDPKSMITQPLISGLIVAYAVDSERTLWYVSEPTF